MGPGDPNNDGNSPDSPDLTCIITGIDDPDTKSLDESIECRVSYQGVVADPPAYDEVRGWIDHDPSDDIVEADMGEGPDEKLEPGDIPEPDGTDVVLRKTYEALPAGAGLDCSPERATIPVSGAGSSHAVTCSLTSDGAPLAGWLIDGENLNGANDPDNDDGFAESIDYDDICTTDAQGRCDFTIDPVDEETGSARLCFWVDEDDDSSFHRTPPRDGSQCVEGVDAPENNNQTDVIEVTWMEAPTAASRALTLSASKQTVTFGRGFVLGGEVQSTDAACAGGVDVIIERTATGGGAFETFETATTSEDGSYRVPHSGDRTASYRALVGEAPGCEAATSEQTTVKVRKKVTLEPSANPVRKGRRVKLRTEVLGCEGNQGHKVALFKRVDGRFKKVGAKSTNDNCRAVFKRRVYKKSAYQARSPKQSYDFLEGVSKVRRLRLR